MDGKEWFHPRWMSVLHLRRPHQQRHKCNSKWEPQVGEVAAQWFKRNLLIITADPSTGHSTPPHRGGHGTLTRVRVKSGRMHTAG